MVITIGETMKLVENELDKCKKDVRKCRGTALCAHTTDNGHNFQFENTSILCFEENNNKKRRICDVVEIMK